MARSVNKAILVGNLTRDPELRYTPQGNAVVSFAIATNRSWTKDSGEKQEETEYHRIVAWNKLAELCSQLLVKGRKVYIEGRLSTRKWKAQDEIDRSITEVIIDDMILLDTKQQEAIQIDTPQTNSDEELGNKQKGKKAKVDSPDEVSSEDIPF